MRRRAGELIRDVHTYRKMGMPEIVADCYLELAEIEADIGTGILVSSNYNEAGRWFVEAGEPEKALDCFRKALDSKGDRSYESGIYMGIGDAYKLLMDYSRAAENFIKAMEHTTRSKSDIYDRRVLVAHNAAECYIKMGENEKAAQLFLDVSKNTNPECCLHYAGLCLLRAGNYESAEQAFTKSSRLHSDLELLGKAERGDSYFYSVLCMDAAGKSGNVETILGRAIEVYDTAMSEETLKGCAFKGIGQCEERLGNLKNAKENLVQAKKPLKDNMASCDSKIAEELRGDYPELAVGWRNLKACDERVLAEAEAMLYRVDSEVALSEGDSESSINNINSSVLMFEELVSSEQSHPFYLGVHKLELEKSRSVLERIQSQPQGSKQAFAYFPRKGGR